MVVAPDAQRDPTDPLGATIQHNADVVRRGRRQHEFLVELGLSVPVTPDDVKQAFRAKALQAHPDRNGGDPEQFRKLQAAFDEAIAFAERNGKRLPWIGTQMPIYLAQREVLRLVESWGGTIELSQIDWLADTVGVDFAQLAERIISIDLSNLNVGDAELKALAADPDGIRYVELLFLANTNVTDEGALEVSLMRNLRYIDLRDTKVTPVMRKQVARLERIERVEGLATWKSWLGGLWRSP